MTVQAVSDQLFLPPVRNDGSTSVPVKQLSLLVPALRGWLLLRFPLVLLLYTLN